MMIRTAGGPGMVSPIDFHERRGPRLSRSTWTAIALVAAAHVGVGVALYYQRFEMPQPIMTDETPITGTILYLRPPPPPIEPEVVEQKPVAPNPPLHRTDNVPANTEVLHADVSDDAKPTGSTTLTFDTPVRESVDDAKPAHQPQPEQPPRVSLIRNPSWERQPTAEQMMRAYPGRALERGVAGSVALNCLVAADGVVSGCAVTGETPTGNGFGPAAQRLSRFFRVNPRTVDGAAEGSRVVINLRFVPPAE